MPTAEKVHYTFDNIARAVTHGCLRAKAGQLAATWEQYETAVHASSNLKAPNECALAGGIGAVATKIRTSARRAGSLGKNATSSSRAGGRGGLDDIVTVHESQIGTSRHFAATPA
jgi:hypothetical protein